MRSTAGGGGSEDDFAEEDAIVVLYTMQTNKLGRSLFVGGAKKWKKGLCTDTSSYVASIRRYAPTPFLFLLRRNSLLEVPTSTHIQKAHCSSYCLLHFVRQSVYGKQNSHYDARQNKISKTVYYYIMRFDYNLQPDYEKWGKYMFHLILWFNLNIIRNIVTDSFIFLLNVR